MFSGRLRNTVEETSRSYLITNGKAASLARAGLRVSVKNQAQYFAFNHNSADCRNFRIARCVNTFAFMPVYRLWVRLKC